MATQTPVEVSDAWTSIGVGPFNGAVQNVGNQPLVGFVMDEVDTAPTEDAGGFAIYSEAQPFSMIGGQELWVRSAGSTGYVVLA